MPTNNDETLLQRYAREERQMSGYIDTNTHLRTQLSESLARESQLREALRQCDRLLCAGGWQPIETAPKDGTFILVTGFNYGAPEKGRHYAVAAWCERRGSWHEEAEWDENYSCLAYLAHWIPLPPAPEPAK